MAGPSSKSIPTGTRSFNVRVPGYRRHAASGLARVTLGKRTIYLGPFGTAESKREYQRVISEWLSVGCRPPSTDAQNLTVVEFLDAFWKHLQTTSPSESTIERFKQAVRLLRDHAEFAKVSELSPSTIRTIQKRLIEERGNCVTTIRDRVAAIRAMLKWGKVEGFIPIDVYERCKDVRGATVKDGAKSQTRRKPLADAEFVKALAILPPMLADMALLQKLTGMRPGEVCFINWHDIDRTNPAVWYYVPGKHKTGYLGKTRTIPLGDRCKAVLMKYRETILGPLFSPQAAERQRLEALHKERRTPMTPSQERRHARALAREHDRDRAPGSMWRTDSYRRAIQRALKSAGLASWFPYMLRHTRATELRKEFGLDAAQLMLGHSDQRTTERYTELDRDVLAKLAV